MKKISIICGIVGLIPFQVMAWSIFGPANYDECILANIKDTQTSQAVIAVKQSCKERFKLKPQKESEFPEEALKKIEGQSWVVQQYDSPRKGDFIMNIFNQNSEWFMTSLDIRIADNKTGEFRDYKANAEAPNLDLGLPPMSSGYFSFTPYLMPTEHSWTILRAYGYKK